MIGTETRFPEGGGFHVIATGCDIVEGTAPDRGLALRKVRAAMTPPRAEQAEGWLVMLQAATARRAESEAFNAAALTLYSGALMRYPADVAKTGCAELARGKGGVTWWPTLGELMDVCDRLVSARAAMLAALERKPPLPALSHDRDAMLEETRKTVGAKFRALAKDMRECVPAPPKADFSKSQGRPDETGITPQLRALIQRQAADQA